MDQLSDGVVRFAFFGNPGPLCEAIRRGVSAAQNGSGATRRWRTTARTRSISDTTHAVTAMSRHYWGRVVASDINVFLRRTRLSINAILIDAHAVLAGDGPHRQTSSEFATAGK